MAMAEQEATEGFWLRDSRDLLKKLRWELENLFCRQRHDVEACEYLAYNCAVTAWHVSDWLFEDIPDELRRSRGWKTLSDFQQFIRSECSALTLCWASANASKHRRVKTTAVRVSDGEGHGYGNPIIVDGTQRHDASAVFWEALRWYEDFLQSEGILLDEPFVPLGDQ
jgi:hypothetical protein